MHQFLPRATAALASALLALGILVATAVPVVACSCIGPQPMAAYAGDANEVIFTGVVQPPDGRGVPVRVTRWFQGPDRNAFVWLAGGDFGADGASCGTPLPAAGTEWIFVAYRSPDGPELGVNLCTPHASANTAEGRAMFADAVATFGEGQVTDPASQPPSPTAATSNDAALPLPLLVASVVGALGLLSGLALVARRRRGGAADRV